MDPEGASIQVLYALPDEQIIVALALEPGMTAKRAVELSGLLERFPSIRAEPLVLGIWGVEIDPEQRLEPGDRVEISRPLEADPRDMRREMLSDGRVMGGARARNQALRRKAEG